MTPYLFKCAVDSTVILPTFSQIPRSAMYTLVHNNHTGLFIHSKNWLNASLTLILNCETESLAQSWQSVIGVCEAMTDLCLFGTNLPKKFHVSEKDQSCGPLALFVLCRTKLPTTEFLWKTGQRLDFRFREEKWLNPKAPYLRVQNTARWKSAVSRLSL